LPEDKFFKTVLSGSLRAGQDQKNPLRGNFLASGLREAIGHLLDSLASDEEVRRCVWFVQDKNTPTVTRQQKANYIVRAGLPDWFVGQTLKINVRDHTKPLTGIMDRLHRATHVRPDTILSDDVQIRQMADDVLSGIDQLLQAADDSRKAITQAVEMVLFREIFDTFFFDTLDDLDVLSTHTTVSGHFLDTVTVTKLDSTEICYRATGNVDVELQYGSASDIENDMGMESEDSYPYIVNVNCDVTNPMKVDIRHGDLIVDTDGFYL